MSVLYRIVKHAWRVVVPRSAYERAFNGRSRSSRAILALKRTLEKTASHNELYDAVYYSRGTESKDAYAVGIVAAIKQLMAPSSVIDVGCGSGNLLAQFRDSGVPGKGLDYSDAAIKICHAKRLDVGKFDLETAKSWPSGWHADLVISTEVAEHLPESCANNYVDLMCAMATRYVIITAAPPGQGGTDHVNEQPPAYWIEKFKQRGWSFSVHLTEKLKTARFDEHADPARVQNVLAFDR